MSEKPKNGEKNGRKPNGKNGKDSGGGFKIGFGKVDKNGVKIVKEFHLNFKKAFVWAMILVLFVPAILGLWKVWRLSIFPFPCRRPWKISRQKRSKKFRFQDRSWFLFYKEGANPEDKLKTSRKESTESLNQLLERIGVQPDKLQVTIEEGKFSNGDWLNVGSNVLFFVGLAIFFFWMMRQARGAQEGMFGFGKSNAKLFTKGKQNIKFTDVGGLKEAKQEVEEIVDFLKNPKKYQKLGARTPKGVLLIGPSGTGKTLLARAIAGEADVPFYSMAGSEFMEMLVGVGASRVRDLFSTAKAHAPSIIFIDEIDAIGQARGGALTGGHGEREQTLNQILVEMDGFEPNEQVVVCAATNRPDVLDSALVRPGRFDRRVTLDLPDLEERVKILQLHAKINRS